MGAVLRRCGQGDEARALFLAAALEAGAEYFTMVDDARAVDGGGLPAAPRPCRPRNRTSARGKEHGD
jgi:hypothetical protein